MKHIINSCEDVRAYVKTTHSDVVAQDLTEDLAESIWLDADCPEWGTDWTEWLEENVGRIRERLVELLKAEAADNAIRCLSA